MSLIHKVSFLLMACLSLTLNRVEAEELYHSPMDPPLTVTGTFGEFRGTHFHAGVDFSTNRITGKKIYAIESGYISRIKVAPDGYGNALYLTLEDGKTAVYGHLSRFNKEIALRVAQQQESEGSSFVDFTLNETELPMYRGENIAFSGDTGGVPPHLHFELRDEKENLLNPLLFGFKLHDTTAPKILALALVPFYKEQIPLGEKHWKIFKPSWKPKQKEYHLSSQTLPVGSFGVEIAIVDDSFGNKCAPVKVTLSQGSEIIFQRDFTKLTWKDYKQNFAVYNRNLWMNKKGIFERLYNLPNGKLSFQRGNKNTLGLIQLEPNQTQTYSIEIEDAAQNRSILTFSLKGSSTLFVQNMEFKKEPVSSKGKGRYRFLDDQIELNFAYNTLYYPSIIEVEALPKSTFPNKESIHQIIELTPEDIVLKKEVEMVFRSSIETLKDSDLYLFNQRRQDWRFIKNQKKSKKKIKASIRNFGIYSLLEDQEPPTIQPIRLVRNSRTKSKILKFEVQDDLSGVNYRQIQILKDNKPLIFTMNLNQREVSVPINTQKGSKRITIIVPDYSDNKREITVDLSKLQSKKIPS